MRLVGYCRVSTEGQADNTSLPSQQERITAYCQALGHELLTFYIDTASGKDLDRPRLRQALFHLKRSGVDGLIVAKLDRLSRSVRDLLALSSEYFTSKALVVLDLNIDTSTPAGRAMFTMMGAMAQLERETIRERTLNGLKYKLEKTGWMGGIPPYGTRWNGEKLVECRHEQVVLALCRRMKERAFTYQDMAKALNSMGRLRPGGHRWRMITVKHLFESKLGDGHTAITFDVEKHVYRKLRAKA